MIKAVENALEIMNKLKNFTKNNIELDFDAII